MLDQHVESTTAESLISLPALVLLATAFIVILIALFPGTEPNLYQSVATVEQQSADPIEQLQQRLQENPQDFSLYLSLARAYQAKGQLMDAEAMLEAGLQSPQLSPRREARAGMVLAEIYQQRLDEAKDAPQRLFWRRTLLSHLTDLSNKELSEAELQTLASKFVELERLDLAVDSYFKLASGNPQQAAQWWSLAAVWQKATGDYLPAAVSLTRAYAAETDENRRLDWALEIVDTLVSAQRMDRATEAVDYYLMLHPENPALLQRASALAQVEQDNEQAAEINQQLLVWQPESQPLLRRQRELEINRGNLPKALALAESLLQQDDTQDLDYEWMARLLEWQGQTNRAVHFWDYLSRTRGLAHDHRQYLRVARLVGNSLAETQALQRLDSGSELSFADSQQLIRGYLAEEDTVAAWRAIKRQTNQLGPQPEPWRQLVQMQLESEASQTAIVTWESYERRFGQTPATRLTAMDVYWRSDMRNDAYRIAQTFGERLAQINSPYHLALIGELAWTADDKVLATKAYERQWALGDSDPLMLHRLLSLAKEQGDEERYIVLNHEQWQRTGSSEYFLAALGMADQRQDRLLIDQLLSEGQHDSALKKQADYWFYRARQQMRLNKFPQALANFERAVNLRDNFSQAQVSAAWAALLAEDKDNTLYWTERVARQKPSNARDRLLAASYFVLDEPAKSLDYFVRILGHQAHDYLWLLSFSDALQAAERSPEAYQIRRYALRRVRQLPVARPASEKLSAREVQLLRTYAGFSDDASLRNGLLNAADEDTYQFQEFVHAWRLSPENYEYARFWLLKQHAQRLSKPFWQQVLLASQTDNAQSVDQLLQLAHGNVSEHPNDSMSKVVSRLSAGTPKPLVAESPAQVKVSSAESIMPQAPRLSVSIAQHEAGDLTQQGAGLAYRQRLGNWQISAFWQQWKNVANNLLAPELADEQRLGLSLQRQWQDGQLTLGLAQRQRDDADLTQWSLQLEQAIKAHRLSASVKNQHNVEYGMVNRLLAAQDVLAASWQWSDKERYYWRLLAETYQLNARESGTALAEGQAYTAEGGLLFKLRQGIASLGLRAETVNNQRETVPDLLQQRLGRAVSQDEIVTEQASAWGIGLGWQSLSGAGFGVMLDLWLRSFSESENTLDPLLNSELNYRLSEQSRLQGKLHWGKSTQLPTQDAELGASLNYHYRFEP